MSNKIEIGSKMLWITSFPHGAAMVVEILGEHPDKSKLYWIRKPDGGSDSTDADFLFALPDGVGACRTN